MHQFSHGCHLPSILKARNSVLLRAPWAFSSHKTEINEAENNLNSTTRAGRTITKYNLWMEQGWRSGESTSGAWVEFVVERALPG